MSLVDYFFCTFRSIHCVIERQEVNREENNTSINRFKKKIFMFFVSLKKSFCQIIERVIGCGVYVWRFMSNPMLQSSVKLMMARWSDQRPDRQRGDFHESEAKRKMFHFIELPFKLANLFQSYVMKHNVFFALVHTHFKCCQTFPFTVLREQESVK